MKSQLGVSYSINYVFTCGKRRVRICRNIYDQTNNTEYLVEEGSKGIVGGKQNEDLGNSRLHQEKQGVFQGQKKSSSSSSCFGGNRNTWVISSQKQLLLVGTAEGNQTADESRMGHHKSQQRSEAEENNKIGGGCMKSVGLGQCVKKCQNVECISSSQSSYLNQSKFNLTPSSTSDGKENSYDLSISQNSGQNLRLITDFYLHEISEVRGVLQSILLLRIEDTFYDLDEQVGTSNKEETTHQCTHQSDNRMHNHNHIYATSLKTSPAHKNYIYNRKVLNGFLFKQNGLYMQFASPSLLADDLSRFSKYSSYYPNSTSLTLKNDNFSFQFLITQTDEGIFVDGALESRSHLVKAEEKLTYHVSVLQQEVAQIKMHEMNTIPQQSTNQINKSTLLNESSKGSSDHQKRIHQHIEQEDDEEDTQCSSLTIQINNNRNGNYQNDSENNFQQGRIRNSSQGQSKKKSSTKKGLKHNQQYSAETEKKQTKKVNKYSTNQSNEDCQNDINLSNQKKASQISKKAALCKQHKPVQSSTYNEDEEEEEILKHCVSSSSKMQTNTNRYYPNDEIDKEDDDNEQNSWDSHSKISTQQHDQSHHKNYDLQSHNDELNSSLNNNIPVQPKKNVVKNFVKAFRNFVNNWGDEGRIMQAIGITTHEELINFRLQYKKYESIHKFNNTFIKALILNDPFKPVFDYFVNEVAWEWLDKSQVNNKKAHKDVLRDYIKATQDPSKIDEIHSLRTRNRQSCKKIKC